MSAEKIVYAQLAAAAAVTALVGTRIYPGQAPQGTATPFIVYEHLSAEDLDPIGAVSGGTITRAVVSVTAVGAAYADVKSVLEAARAALRFASGLISGKRVVSIETAGVGPDLTDPDLGVFYQSADYAVVFYPD